MRSTTRRFATTCLTVTCVTAALTATLTATGGAALAHPGPAASAHAGHGADVSARRIPFTAANVTQNSDGTFTVSWSADRARRVTVYAGTDQNRISHRRAVAVGAGTATVTVSGLGTADRWWFELVPDRGSSLTLADRSLHLASAPNFRDAGGYRTADGHWVRMGILYRANDLGRLTDADQAKLKRLGIRTDIDFRTDSEVAASPDRIPAGVTYVHANVMGTSTVSGDWAAALTTEAGGVAMMVAGEKAFVSADPGRAAYRTFFTTITDRGAANVVYHCTAGKDRTGWASAALLTALGVPADTVMADYLLSNDYLAASNAATLAAVPAAIRPGYQAVLDVRPEYLRSGFDEVTTRYGTFDNYLRTALGLTPKDLKTLKSHLLIG